MSTMYSGESANIIIQYHTWINRDGTEQVGEPTVEAYPSDDSFQLLIGGMDYYAQSATLNTDEATQLRDALNTWLDERT